jgi:dihydrolipoamide dehydrogenase
MDLYPVHGRFVADRVIRAGTEELTASKVFIATGSRPQIPAIDGLGDAPFMTSREALRCTTLPKRLLVIGAGYIAVELGGAYAAAGAEVDFIVRSRFLRQEDRDIADSFSEIFGRSHAVHLGATPLHVDYSSNSFSVICQDPTGRKIELFGDALLVATGVRPCTDNLGLESTNMRINEDGYIQVNGRMQTGDEGVYALGDCVGHYLYRHTVNYEGEYLIRTAIEGADIGPIDYGPVPHAVFSEPEIASVGMTEQRAMEQRKDFVVGKALYPDSNAGMARGYEYGFVKIVVDRATRQILGAHILGDEASNMIHLFIALMKMHGTLDDLLGMIWVHPALPETARDAARDARKRLDDQSP